MIISNIKTLKRASQNDKSIEVRGLNERLFAALNQKFKNHLVSLRLVFYNSSEQKFTFPKLENLYAECQCQVRINWRNFG